MGEVVATLSCVHDSIFSSGVLSVNNMEDLTRVEKIIIIHGISRVKYISE